MAGHPPPVVLEGFHAVKHAVRFGAAITRLAAVDPAGLQRLAADLAPDVADALASAEVVSREELATLADPPPATGVVAIATRPRVDVAGLLAAGGPRPVVLLDRPTHHGNVGAVVRVAAAAGAAAVLTTGTLDPWHRAALRGSAGLHFAVPVARIAVLPAGGRPLVAWDPAAPTAPSIPVGAVHAFGSERRGLSDELLRRADLRTAIAMRPGVSSLNLATSVAVALYSLPPAPPQT